jgi:hypothetical protein
MATNVKKDVEQPYTFPKDFRHISICNNPETNGSIQIKLAALNL